MTKIYEKLDKIYKFYKKLKGEFDISFSMTESFNGYSALMLNTHLHHAIRSKFYKYVVSVFDFDKPPKIVSAKDYKALNKIELYHGYEKYFHGAEYLSGNEVFDFGWIPSGFYVTADRPFAYYHTGRYENHIKEEKDTLKKVLSVKLNTEKICHFNYIKCIREKIQAGDFDDFPEQDNEKIWELINFALTIESDAERLEFVQLFLENYSNLAILLGYDAMYGGFAGYDEDDEQNPAEIEVLNRGIVTVKQSKFDWFLKRAKEEKEVPQKQI